MTHISDSDNEYAVAREMNLLVMAMLMNIYLANSAGLSPNTEIHILNRAYILLVDELQKIYDKNLQLAALKPEPIWGRFDVLKFSTSEIIKHISNPDNDYGSAHFARVERLCILSDVETANFTSEQQKLVDYAHESMSIYLEDFQDIYDRKRARKEYDWLIPSYTIVYKADGTILVNNVLKLKKSHAGSTTERLLEQAINNPHTLFKPDLGKTSRNLSTILSSAGFTPTLRRLFFSTVSESKGIIFRPTVTRQQADDEMIDTAELDLKLKELGATFEPKILT